MAVLNELAQTQQEMQVSSASTQGLQNVNVARSKATSLSGTLNSIMSNTNQLAGSIARQMEGEKKEELKLNVDMAKEIAMNNSRDLSVKTKEMSISVTKGEISRLDATKQLNDLVVTQGAINEDNLSKEGKDIYRRLYTEPANDTASKFGLKWGEEQFKIDQNTVLEDTVKAINLMGKDTTPEQFTALKQGLEDYQLDSSKLEGQMYNATKNQFDADLAQNPRTFYTSKGREAKMNEYFGSFENSEDVNIKSAIKEINGVVKANAVTYWEREQVRYDKIVDDKFSREISKYQENGDTTGLISAKNAILNDKNMSGSKQRTLVNSINAIIGKAKEATVKELKLAIKANTLSLKLNEDGSNLKELGSEESIKRYETTKELINQTYPNKTERDYQMNLFENSVKRNIGTSTVVDNMDLTRPNTGDMSDHEVKFADKQRGIVFQNAIRFGSAVTAADMSVGLGKIPDSYVQDTLTVFKTGNTQEIIKRMDFIGHMSKNKSFNTLFKNNKELNTVYTFLQVAAKPDGNGNATITENEELTLKKIIDGEVVSKDTYALAKSAVSDFSKDKNRNVEKYQYSMEQAQYYAALGLNRTQIVEMVKKDMDTNYYEANDMVVINPHSWASETVLDDMVSTLTEANPATFDGKEVELRRGDNNSMHVYLGSGEGKGMVAILGKGDYISLMETGEGVAGKAYKEMVEKNARIKKSQSFKHGKLLLDSYEKKGLLTEERLNKIVDDFMGGDPIYKWVDTDSGKSGSYRYNSLGM